MFSNREDAGEKLGRKIAEYKYDEAIVLGIPRGGIVVAAEVAKILKTPLDLIIPRKIGAPQNQEVAIGAVCQDGTIIKDEKIIDLYGITENEINKIAEQEIIEIKRRMNKYRLQNKKLEITGKTVILADDGIATGYTVMAALQSLIKENPKKLILAVPVAPHETLDKLNNYVDCVVCLEVPTNFVSVGQYYNEFDQTTDQQVIDLLKKYANNSWIG